MTSNGSPSKTDLKFREEGPTVAPDRSAWTILIVDDEREVHSVTTLALDEFKFAGKGLRFLHAYSGAEAKQMLAHQKDIALVLLDVVMETDHAGLEVVQHIRNTLANKFIRIVLRTGQPGQAPELEVITRYDINDYKYKTELTRERLFTTVYTGLSTYRDLMALDANRHGLEKVIAASSRIFELRSLERFAQGVLEQLTALLFLDGDAVMLHASGVAAEGAARNLRIVAGIGTYGELIGQEASKVLNREVLHRIEEAERRKSWVAGSNYFVGFKADQAGGEMVFYVETMKELPKPDQHLLELFCRNVATARENVRMLNTVIGQA